MRFKVIPGYLFLSLLLLVVIFQALFLALPALVETIIVPPLIQKYLPEKLPQGLVSSDLEFKIEKIGLTHTLVSRIKIGQLMSVDLLDLQYGLKGLTTFCLKKIRISGLTLSAQVDGDNQLLFNGEKLPTQVNEVQRDKGADSESGPFNLDSFLGFMPEQVVIKDSKLSVATTGRKIIIPFEVLSSLDTIKKKGVLSARFHPFGQTVKTIIAGDFTSGIEKIHIQAPSFHPEVFGLFPETADFKVSGPVDIDILKTVDTDWQLSLSQLQLDLPNLPDTRIKKVTASVENSDGKIFVLGGFDLTGPLGSELAMSFELNLLQKKGASPLFDLTIKNKSPDSIYLAAAPNQIEFDLSNFLFFLKGDRVRQAGKFIFDCQNFAVTQGKEKFLVKSIALNSDFKGNLSDKLQKIDLDFQWDLSKIRFFSKTGLSEINGVNLIGKANVTKQGSSPVFDLTINHKKVKEIILTSGSSRMGVQHPNLLFSLKGDRFRQTGQFLFDCQNLLATQGKEQVFVKKFRVRSGINGDFSDKGKGIDLDFQSDLFQMEIISNVAKAGLDGVNLTGKLGITKEYSPLVYLDARIIDGKVESEKYKTRALGFNARLPLVFPHGDENNPGFFSIREIGYDNMVTASLKGSITQSESLGVVLGGDATISEIDGFHLGFEGKAGGKNPSVRLEYVIDPFLLLPAQVEKMMPTIVLGDDSSVQLSSKGSVDYKNHGVKTQASIRIDKGNIFLPDMNLSLNGIAGSIYFNDLMVPESLPGQVVTIDKIRANQFAFDNARARFSIEDGQSINIENLRFNWCNGLVSTESIRLPGKDNILSLILYCDRLELSSLLKQMGAFHAEGEGALSGRIPVVYSDGNLSFDKGFLFSTPGKGGRVVIENTEMLTAGIPMDTPEFVQLDLAREALRDFDYQWAKLELNTFEDTLHMNMELDGKPARLLPFEYQKEMGSFVRVNAQSPGSRFQGIKLNVNLNLPFNQVLKFGNNLNSILN